MIRTYLFDFDGTIAETLPIIISIWNGWGLQKIESKDIGELRKKDAKDILRLSGIPRWRLPWYIRRGRRDMRALIASAPIVPAMDAVLRSLHGRASIGIVTTNTTENVALFLKAHRIENTVDFIQSEPAMFGKARRLKRVMRAHHLQPGETIYVGDELRDVHAAREAGIRIAAVTWGFNAREALETGKPDWVIDEPEALLSLET